MNNKDELIAIRINDKSICETMLKEVKKSND